MMESDSLYTGLEHLDRLAALAKNYNHFLVGCITQACADVSQLVDFGAGTGTFSAALRRQGYNVACVEIDPALRSSLENQGFSCYPNIDAFPEESLDFVFSLNVLEHIEDDLGTLSRIAARLKPGGRMYLYVPAFDLLYSSMDRKVGHYRRYTKGNLLPRLRQAGFHILRARYADSLGFAASLFFKWFGNSQGELSPTGLWLYDRVAFPLSYLLDFLFGGFMGKNLSITAVRVSVPKNERLAA